MFTTNKNITSDIVTDISSIHEPFLLSPAGKDYLWGGRKLRDNFAKQIDLNPLAETWECSVHPDGVSTVASGYFKGMGLDKLLKLHSEMLGTNAHGQLPMLVKLIDAKLDLSVQVHPNDKYASAYENGQRGKTEMWYVLEAAKDAKLVYGFSRDMDRETVEKSIADGTIERYLKKVPIHKDDVIFVPAGQVHAIGAGVVVAEIQESSNLTYRFYDYNRVGKDGKKRPLHIQKALDVVNYKACGELRQPLRIKRFRRGYATELLCRCPYFQVERMLLNTERVRAMANIQTGENTFQVLLCTDGCGVIQWSTWCGQPGTENKSPEQLPVQSMNFYRGDCIFIPAESVPVKIHGTAQLLEVSS